MNMLMVHIICRSDFGKKTGHHLNDIGDGHGADFIEAFLRHCLARSLGENLLADKTLDMRQIAKLYPTG